MKRLIAFFFGDDGGQDLIEYTLLLAFVALASAALFIGSGASVSQIWYSANTILAGAASQNPSNTGGGSGDHH